MPNVVILGSTGSIGTQTLQVLEHLPGYRVLALAAGKNGALLKSQIQKFKPLRAAVMDEDAAVQLRQDCGIPVDCGEDALCELACLPEADLVVVAVVGAAGVRPTISALKAGKKVALANKETLVIAGHLVQEYLSQVVPIDSEHSALWQCFHGRERSHVDRIVLTASGGPFRTWQGSLEEVTIAQALNHPRWKMGGKITIDSATLMNKGLEVIEAHWLFNFPYDRIDVVVHPESIVHSMIRLQDGSLIAQLGPTDMRIPIQYALTSPQVLPAPVPPLDLTQVGRLTFEPVDRRRFPCLDLAYAAGKAGGELPVALNAANEVAVEAFLAGKIGFMDIPRLVEAVLPSFAGQSFLPLTQILEVDSRARQLAHEWVLRGKPHTER